jgi:hypothetical protein
MSIERGQVLWSLVRSDQEIITQADRVTVTNCMLSKLEEPKESVWSAVTAVDCDPNQKIPEKISDAFQLKPNL